MDPISPAELSVAIAQLDVDKAEGLDGVTNSMIKNTGLVARDSLLAMFNNILVSGRTPSTWKEGDIALILKKLPQTDVGNYRPITLISCVPKLLTKILVKRLSVAVEFDDIIGPNQNGFRSHRSCSDSILELNKSRKLKSYLLFVDLKEAYDRVDRNVLFAISFFYCFMFSHLLFPFHSSSVPHPLKILNCFLLFSPYVLPVFVLFAVCI